MIGAQGNQGLRQAIDEALEQPSLCAAFQVTAAANEGLPALRVVESNSAISWARYRERVEAIARGLRARGLGAGDTVALLLRNQPVFNLVDNAALHLGAVPFSLYATEPLEQMLALLEDSDARVLVTEQAFAERAAELAVAPRLDHIVIDAPSKLGSGEGVRLADLEVGGDRRLDFEASWRQLTPDAIATLVYTSGTTGSPKAVEIPHRAVLASLAGVDHYAPVTPAGSGVSFLPASHITDRFICHYQQMAFGGTLTCVPDPTRLWEAIAEARPTRFFGVPRTWEKLADRARAIIEAEPELGAALEVGLARVRREQAGQEPDAATAARESAAETRMAPVRAALGLDRAEWLAVAAAPTSRSVLEFHHAIGLRLAELWGMSEFMMATMNPPDRIKLGTVGVPLPEVEASLAADGELLMRGPHGCARYRNDRERTAGLRDSEGWARTGDLASIDADGYVTIVGRKKDQMINSSGKNLFPVKIEGAIGEASPLIGHVASVGDRRRFVTALIVLDPTELQRFAVDQGLSGDHARLAAEPLVQAEVERAVAVGNERLARVEQVRAWTVLGMEWAPGGDELTNMMKLRRAAIEEKYGAEIERLYSS